MDHTSLINLILTNTYEGDTIISPILNTRKLRHRLSNVGSLSPYPKGSGKAGFEPRQSDTDFGF